jgi:Tfp pilus assembly protein PilN
MTFGNTTTSRAEGGHVKLKRALGTSIDDLKQVVEVIELLLKNQRAEYVIAHEEAKTRVPQSCKLVTLQKLQGISHHALKLIRQQLNKMKMGSLSLCIRTYETFI